MVLNTCQEFESGVASGKIRISDIRYLKTKNGIVYAIASVRAPNSILNPPVPALGKFMPWIHFFVINPEHLQKGLGSLFVKYLASELGKKMASKIYFESSGFFIKQGFKLVFSALIIVSATQTKQA
jgi:hypothetical protein